MLNVEHLSYRINENGADVQILDDVSFSVDDGEMLVVTGPNGGGKSTIAKILMGIEKASGGKISGRRGYHRLYHRPEGRSRHRICIPAASKI